MKTNIVFSSKIQIDVGIYIYFFVNYNTIINFNELLPTISYKFLALDDFYLHLRNAKNLCFKLILFQMKGRNI